MQKTSTDKTSINLVVEKTKITALKSSNRADDVDIKNYSTYLIKGWLHNLNPRNVGLSFRITKNEKRISQTI